MQAHLHSLNVVHCDLKPENILLRSSSLDTRGFVAKIADFGLSRVVGSEGVFVRNSGGTINYVAPGEPVVVLGCGWGRSAWGCMEWAYT